MSNTVFHKVEEQTYQEIHNGEILKLKVFDKYGINGPKTKENVPVPLYIFQYSGNYSNINLPRCKYVDIRNIKA